MVDSVIGALTANATIRSVTSTNTRVVVAAGGFEGGTNPSFVFTVKDSGAGSVTQADVDVLGNALGYVLSQGSTTHFSPDNFKAYAFPLDYAGITRVVAARDGRRSVRTVNEIAHVADLLAPVAGTTEG